MTHKIYYSELFGEEVLIDYGGAATERRDLTHYTTKELLLLKPMTDNQKKLIHHAKKLFEGVLYKINGGSSHRNKQTHIFNRKSIVRYR